MSRRLAKYWEGKSVLVTGASSGLGWAVVEALAPYRIKFCLLSRREDKMLALALKLKDSGSTFWINTCDVRDRKQVFAAVQKFQNQTGSIDVAWVNSGIGVNSAFNKWNWEKIHDTINTNLLGSIYTIRACLEVMVPQNSGTIVGIGSAASMRGLPTRAIYSLTKIGIEYFLESAAAEFSDLQFTMIHPGFVDTPLTQTNQHSMPFLMTAPKAAGLIVRAIEKKKMIYAFPFFFSTLVRILGMLPRTWYRAIMSLKIANYSKE